MCFLRKRSTSHAMLGHLLLRQTNSKFSRRNQNHLTIEREKKNPLWRDFSEKRVPSSWILKGKWIKIWSCAVQRCPTRILLIYGILARFVATHMILYIEAQRKVKARVLCNNCKGLFHAIQFQRFSSHVLFSQGKIYLVYTCI